MSLIRHRNCMMNKIFTNITKNLILLSFSGLLFYFVFPKYFFSEKGDFRGNKITGKVERFHSPQIGWVDITESAKEKVIRLERLVALEKARLLSLWKSQISMLPPKNEWNVFSRHVFEVYGGNKTEEELNSKAEEIAKQNLGISDTDLYEYLLKVPFRNDKQHTISN